MNSLASAAQLNQSMVVYYDRLFRHEQEQLLPLVGCSTVQIRQIYKFLKISSKREDHVDFYKSLVELGNGGIILSIMLYYLRNGLRILECRKTVS